VVREEANTGLWWGNLRERGHLGDPGGDRRRIFGPKRDKVTRE
jgi:hypothetical protein